MLKRACMVNITKTEVGTEIIFKRCLYFTPPGHHPIQSNPSSPSLAYAAKSVSSPTYKSALQRKLTTAEQCSFHRWFLFFSSWSLFHHQDELKSPSFFNRAVLEEDQMEIWGAEDKLLLLKVLEVKDGFSSLLDHSFSGCYSMAFTYFLNNWQLSKYNSWFWVFTNCRIANADSLLAGRSTLFVPCNRHQCKVLLWCLH